jgi:membrane protease YdiL (CAAX protease family)
LAILVAAFVSELLVFGATSSPASGRWPYASATEAVARHLALPGALTLGVSMGVVLLLGWQAVTGLAAGAGSRWALAPTLALGFLSVVVFAKAAGPVADAGFLSVLLVGLALMATAEEVIFRGFLLHGLTRRLDGETAVFASSWLFAAAHLPSLIVLRVPFVGVAITLVALFGFAVVLCRIRAETGSIWWPAGVHTLWNFATIGVTIAPTATRGLETPVGLVKLVLIVVGLVMAFGLARRHQRRRAGQTVATAPPPMPLAPWAPPAASPAPALPPPPPPGTDGWPMPGGDGDERISSTP